MNQYIFHKIRPLIEKIISNPTLEDAKRLFDELSTETFKRNLLPGRDDFVFIAILKQIPELTGRNQNEIKIHLINSVAKIIEFSKIKSLVAMKTTLVILLQEIYVGERECSIRKNLSEELKFSLINCFGHIFRLVETDVIELFYVKENRILIAQALSVCVDIINGENYRALRIKAIECIEAVHHVHDNADFSDIVLRDQIANLIFILLPKVLATLRDVAVGDEKQGHIIISSAIRVLGRVLRLIMHDKIEDSTIPSIQDIKSLVVKSQENLRISEVQDYSVLKLTSKSSAASDKLRQIEEKERSDEWLKAAAKKLQPVIESLRKLTGNKNEKIRDELAIAVDDLLCHCSRNMSVCVPALLELKIALDEETNRKTKFKYSDTLLESIENIFTAHLIKLPRIIYTGDEDEQRANFLLLKGLIRALSSTNRLKIQLSNENTQKNLITALTSAVELERSMHLLEENYTIRLVEENIAENQTAVHNPTPWKEYKNIRNASLETIIRNVCKLLRQNEDARNLILDSLLASFAANSQTCNEILVLFQFFVGKPGSLDSLIDTAILEELLNDTRWDLSIGANTSTRMDQYGGASRWYEDRTEGLYESAISIRTTDVAMQANNNRSLSVDSLITINDAKFNVLHMCLVLETVGLYAEMLKERFQKFLLKSLHRILEKAGSSHYMIHSAGFFALNRLTMSLNSNSIAELIHSNSDYISYYVNVSLKHADQSKNALDILNVVLQYSTLESMPHLENIVATVLTESAKKYQSTNATSFLRVFSTLLIAFRNWTTEKPEDNTQSKVGRSKFEPCKIDFDKWFELLEGSETDEFEDALMDTEIDLEAEAMEVLEAHAAAEDEPVAKPKPLHIDLTLKIMERSLRYLASKKQEDKIIVLEALGTGFDILKDEDDDLLPMAHKVWAPFVERIKDNNPVILRRCFHLLQKLAVYAKDFIYHRWAKEVLPLIITFLQQNSKKPASRYQGFSYEQSQEFHLLQELLAGLPTIVSSLGIQEKKLDDILESTLWLLDKNQQKTLQSNCVQFFLDMCDYDTPTIFVKLLKLKSDDRYAVNVNKIYRVIEEDLKEDYMRYYNE